jgi:hypothetical protein
MIAALLLLAQFIGVLLILSVLVIETISRQGSDPI